MLISISKPQIFKKQETMEGHSGQQNERSSINRNGDFSNRKFERSDY